MRTVAENTNAPLVGAFFVGAARRSRFGQVDGPCVLGYDFDIRFVGAVGPLILQVEASVSVSYFLRCIPQNLQQFGVPLRIGTLSK